MDASPACWTWARTACWDSRPDASAERAASQEWPAAARRWPAAGRLPLGCQKFRPSAQVLAPVQSTRRPAWSVAVTDLAVANPRRPPPRPLPCEPMPQNEPRPSPLARSGVPRPAILTPFQAITEISWIGGRRMGKPLISKPTVGRVSTTFSRSSPLRQRPFCEPAPRGSCSSSHFDFGAGLGAVKGCGDER